MDTSDKLTAVFVADAHFHLNPDATERRRVDKFVAFLDTVAGVPHLFLLGDIFDFWFDYPHFRLKGYEEILQALDRVCNAGTQVHFVGGNHDIWAAGYLHGRYGSEPDGRSLTVGIDGLRIRAIHGDGVLGRDWAYKAFRRIVRARAGVLFAKTIHPEVFYTLCTWLSGRSRAANRDEVVEIEAKAATWLAQHSQADWDLLVMGHVHHPLLLEQNGRRLALLGGWLDGLHYGQLRGRNFELADFSV
jgi:UDP-2,3-diacylglucosamine hydrolase